jgi:hypothetical protein
MRRTMGLCLRLLCGLTLAMAAGAAASARDFEMGGDTDYPYWIMTPEPGTALHHRRRVLVPKRRVTARCAFRSGLYNEPGIARIPYMGSCVQ